MAHQTDAELKLAEIMVEALDLEDIDASDIDSEMALFGVAGDNCLGLDSIDALEIALAISKHYGVQLKAEDENTQAIFTSVKTLSDFIIAQS